MNNPQLTPEANARIKTVTAQVMLVANIAPMNQSRMQWLEALIELAVTTTLAAGPISTSLAMATLPLKDTDERVE